ncbi:MAG: GNVR domain-containing protein, partial [Bacteroidota bacterium]
MTPSLNGNGQMHHPEPQKNILIQEETIDLRPFFYRFLRNWYWIAFSVAACIGLAVLYLMSAPEIYKVKGSLLVRSDDRRGMSAEDFVFSELGFGETANLENELQILKSYPVLNQVIDSLNLEFTYSKQEGLKTTDLYGQSPVVASVIKMPEKQGFEKVKPETFALIPESEETFQIVMGEADSIKASYSIPFYRGDTIFLVDKVAFFDYPIQLTLRDRSELLNYYLEALKVELLEDSDILALSMEDEAPQRAIDFINQLITIYNQSIIKEKRVVAENTLQFIEERLEYITKELYDVEKQAERYMVRNEVPIELESSSSFYLDEISKSDKVIAELKFQQSFVKNLQEYLEQSANKYNFLSSLPEIGESSGFGSSIEQYNQLLASREKLLVAANPSNPQVILLEEQITSLRRSVLASLDQIDKDLSNRITQMQEKVDPIVSRLNNIPKNQRELLQIMRQQQIKQSLFLFLLEKREETGLTLAAQVADTRIINPPTNLEQVAPKKAIILVGSLFLGLFLPLMLLTLQELFRNTIDNEEDIKQMTNTPILGTIA